MFSKGSLPKISAKNLQAVDNDPSSRLEHGLEEMLLTIRTPRHSTYNGDGLDAAKTQKLPMAKRTSEHREKLPSLFKHQDPLKENLLDLDLCFDLEWPKHRPGRQTDRLNFVIRKQRTTSRSSKEGKDTSAGSESSLDGVQDLLLKNATDSPQVKLEGSRGKSLSRHLQPCRIVNSKKLPFDLNQALQKKRKSKFEEFDLNISRIELI